MTCSAIGVDWMPRELVTNTSFAARLASGK